jgi:hypothetical protein
MHSTDQGAAMPSQIHSRHRLPSLSMRPPPSLPLRMLLAACVAAMLLQCSLPFEPVPVSGAQIFRYQLYHNKGDWADMCSHEPFSSGEVEEGACMADSTTKLHILHGQDGARFSCELVNDRPHVVIRGFEDNQCRERSVKDVWPIKLDSSNGRCGTAPGSGERTVIRWDECVPGAGNSAAHSRSPSLAAWLLIASVAVRAAAAGARELLDL